MRLGRPDRLQVTRHAVTVARQRLGEDEDPAPGFTKTPVSGLGDDAFYTLIGPFGSLSVKKGDTVFIVRIYGIPDTDKQLAIDKSLAHEVIARM